LRFGYNQAPDLAYWWLDGYLDLEESQSPRVRDAIREWFRWHRATQLADYAALLARVQGELPGPLTPAQVCRWNEEIETRLDVAFQRAVPAIVDLARTLTPTQLAHLQRRYAKNNAQYRSEYLQTSTEERMRASARRVVERAETFYGRLDDVQRERIAQWMGDSPFDPQGWLVERQRRQQDIEQVLRRLFTEPLPADEAQAAVRRVYDQAWHSPRDAYRAYQERLAAYNCGFVAQVHNLMTPEQKRRAIAKLKGWEDDLRALAGS
jgi:hypothetical protein